MPDDGRNRLLDLWDFDVNAQEVGKQALVAPLSGRPEFERPAYVLNNKKWGNTTFGTSGGAIRWMIVGANQVYPSDEYTAAAMPVAPVYNATIRAAFDRWEQVGNFDFVEVSDWATADIFVIFDELTSEGSSTIGLAQTYSYGARIDSSYISFDIGRRYRLIDGSVQILGTPQNSNTLSLYTLTLHEVGHALGLSHEDDIDTIMNSSDTPSITDLTQDEIDGIQAIYGTKGSTGPVDDYAGSTATTGTVAVGGSVTGSIEIGNDSDWFSVTLTAGVTYRVNLDGGTLADPYVYVRNASGTSVASDDDTGTGLNALLTYTPTATGVYYIDARGANSTDTGTYTLRLTQTSVADDYANSTSTTGVVATPTNGTVNGNIESSGDADWFRVSLTAGTTYTFSMVGTTLSDPYLYLRNSSGTSVASDDDSGAGLNALFTYTPTGNGTFYLDARAAGSGTGTYSIAVTGVASGGASDDYAHSASTTGIVTVGAPGTAVSGTIGAIGDVDWFRVTLTAGTSYRFRLEGGTLADTALYVRNAAGLILSSDTDGGNGQLTYTATSSGSYYLDVRASASGTGTYTIAADNLALDDFGTTAATAGSINVGSTAAGNIESAGDRDWVRVDLTAGVTYRFDLRGAASGGGTLANPFLTLLSASGTFITTDDDSGAGADAQMTYTATATGAHYLAASGFGSTETGTYTLAANLAADDYAATVATTGVLAVGGTASGYIHEAGDVDWFRVTLAAGTQYQFDARGSASSGGTLVDPAVVFVDSGGMALRADNDSGVGADGRLIFTPSASGVYYVGARSNTTDGTGSYTVALTANPDDYVGSAVTTGTVAVGGYVGGNIETANDRDWFKLTLTAGTAYRVSVRGADARYGTLSNPQLSILSAAGATLVSDDDTGFGLDAAASFTPTTTGTYYIEARGALGGAGTYTVFVAAQATDDYAATTATTGVATVGGTVGGKTEVMGDRDWFRIALTAGTTYRIRLETEQYGSLPSTFASARLRDSSGTALIGEEETGATAVAELTYTPTATGTFYIDAEAYNLGSANYRISVATATSSMTVEAENAGLTDAELAAITAPPAVRLEDMHIAAAPLAAQRERSPLELLAGGALALPPEDRDLAMTADPFQRLPAFQPSNAFTLFPSG